MSATTDGGKSGPRILFLAYQISPHDARYLKLRESFLEAGFAVHAIAPAAGAAQAHESVETVSAPPGSASRARAWLNARHLKSRLVSRGAAFRPDLIYVFDPEALPAALALKSRTGAKLLYDAHEFHEEEDLSAPERCAWVKRTEIRAAPEIDIFATVNRSIGELYEAERPDLPQPHVVHNALRPAPPPRYDGRLHRAAHLPEETRILLYHGGLARMRGLDRLATAARLLNEDWAVVMMGTGPLANTLEAAANQRLRLLPPCPHDELLIWASGASLGAILYEDEGRSQHYCSPNKLWEYAAAGVPALASDLPEIARVVSGHRTGFLVPFNATPPDIAAAVNSLNSEQLSTASSAARKFSRLESWDQEFAPLLESVLNYL